MPWSLNLVCCSRVCMCGRVSRGLGCWMCQSISPIDRKKLPFLNRKEHWRRNTQSGCPQSGSNMSTHRQKKGKKCQYWIFGIGNIGRCSECEAEQDNLYDPETSLHLVFKILRLLSNRMTCSSQTGPAECMMCTGTRLCETVQWTRKLKKEKDWSGTRKLFSQSKELVWEQRYQLSFILLLREFFKNTTGCSMCCLTFAGSLVIIQEICCIMLKWNVCRCKCHVHACVCVHGGGGSLWRVAGWGEVEDAGGCERGLIREVIAGEADTQVHRKMWRSGDFKIKHRNDASIPETVNHF